VSTCRRLKGESNLASSMVWANPAENCRLSVYEARGCDGDNALKVFKGKKIELGFLENFENSYSCWLNDKILSYRVHCI
jgi:hypothetical protein